MSRSRIIIGIVVVLSLSALGYFGYQNFLAPAPPTPTAAVIQAQASSPAVVSAEGKIIPARDATLAFRLAGRVAEVLVKEGDAVKKDEAVIRLEAADLQAAVAQAEAALSLAKANRDAVLAGARSQEVEAAEKQLSAANATVAQAAAQLAQLKEGATQDQIAAAEAAIAQAESAQKQVQIAYDKIIENIKFLAGPTEEQTRFQLNAANENLTAAQAALTQLQAGANGESIKAAQAAVWAAASQRDAVEAQLDLLKAGASDEQKEAAEAQVAQAQAALEAAQAQLAQTELRAPFAGTVVSLNVEVGEVVAPSVPALVLADLSHWQVRTNDLSETDVVLVQPGQAVTITLDAFADQTFSGTVAEIGSLAETNRGNTTYPVTIQLDATDVTLRWGMTAFADINVEK
ncbi:MAG: efflux RND transporter periplasmic adaptor subunit [Chloroflexi bacterium]|nr:efflux RND transporter periplasmic adaptor subunit [Chloroflexota bacterium]